MCFGSKPKIQKSQISAPRPMPLPQHTHTPPVARRPGPPAPRRAQAMPPRAPPLEHAHPAYLAHAHAPPHAPRHLPPRPGPPPRGPLPALPTGAVRPGARKQVRLVSAATFIPAAHSAQICHVNDERRSHARPHAASFQIHGAPVYAPTYKIPRKPVPMAARIAAPGVNPWEHF